MTVKSLVQTLQGSAPGVLASASAADSERTRLTLCAAVWQYSRGWQTEESTEVRTAAAMKEICFEHWLSGAGREEAERIMEELEQQDAEDGGVHTLRIAEGVEMSGPDIRAALDHLVLCPWYCMKP